MTQRPLLIAAVVAMTACGAPGVPLGELPPSDLLTPNKLLVRKEGSDEVVFRVEVPTIDGSTLKFAMPDLGGDGRYTFEPTGVPVAWLVGVVRCEGPTRCEARCNDVDVIPAAIDFAR